MMQKKLLAAIAVGLLAAIASPAMAGGPYYWVEKDVKFQTRLASVVGATIDSLSFSHVAGTSVDTTQTLLLWDLIPADQEISAVADSIPAFNIFFYPDKNATGDPTEAGSTLGGVGMFVDFSIDGTTWVAGQDSSFQADAQLGALTFARSVAYFPSTPTTLNVTNFATTGALFKYIRFRCVTGIDATDSLVGTWKMKITHRSTRPL